MTRGIQLSEAVPFGRSLNDSCRMFGLTSADLSHCTFLDVAAGPASFTAEVREVGGHAAAVDPIYRFSAARIRSRMYETLDDVMQKVSEKATLYHWEDGDYPNFQALRRARLEAMESFLEHFTSRDAAERFICAALPNLPLQPRCFDFALCSHFLFLYDHLFGEAFHIAAIEEMLRVAREVRIYPVTGMNGERSVHLPAVVRYARANGVRVRRQDVPVRVLRGSYEMLCLWR